MSVAPALAHPLTFSDLKQFAKSPAHYKHGRETRREPTRAMLRGTITDRLVFGVADRPLHVWPSKRQGNAWLAFEAAHAGEDIVTQAEVDEARPIAEAVLAHPIAMKYLTGDVQVPLAWERDGFPCRTRGVDCVGAEFISDLKVSHTAQPDRLERHARSMGWNTQLAWYLDACARLEMGIGDAYLVAVEATAPYPVTVMRMSAAALEEGRRSIALWLETLRGCVLADEFPGYVQDVIEMGGGGLFGLEGLEDGDE